MTSREREAIVERAVEGGLLDEVVEAAEAAEGSMPVDGSRAAILSIREKLRELLGERPRQTRRLVRAAVRAVWRRKGLDWREDAIADADWEKFLSVLEGS